MTPQQESHLALAQRHVAEGEERIAKQTALIEELAQNGLDTIDAQALLTILNETLILMHGHLDLIVDEIAGEA